MNELGLVMLVVFVALVAMLMFSRKNNNQNSNSSMDEQPVKQPKAVVDPAVEEKTVATPAEKDSKIVVASEDSTSADSVNKAQDLEVIESAEGGRKFSLVVDDPCMTGEIEPDSVPDPSHKPSFGIPEEEKKSAAKVAQESEEKETFVLVVMNSSTTISVQEMHHVLQGMGAKITSGEFYVIQNNRAEDFITIANVYEPGIFPVENAQTMQTPGVVLILELPTVVHAPKAMHEFIMLARRLCQRLEGRMYDKDRNIVNESDLQSLRDKAINYESQAIV